MASHPLVGDTCVSPPALPSRCSRTCVYVSVMKKSISAMMKMEMGTPKSPIKRRACGDTMTPLNTPVSPPSRGVPPLTVSPPAPSSSKDHWRSMQ